MLILNVNAHSQVTLNAAMLLVDEMGNPVEGVYVGFSVQAAGAVFSANQVTDVDGNAAVTITLPNGTMQGLVNAGYMNCDSSEVVISGTFSANVLGGLNPVELVGTYCGNGGGLCDFELDGGPTVLGSWMFMVTGAPEDAVFDWTIDGATSNNANDATFGWQFDGEGVWNVCVFVTSAGCDPWTDCWTVDTTDPSGGGGECELEFEVVQALDELGEPIPGTLEVVLPPLGGQPWYFWDFGDESTSTEANPSHVYAGNGPYMLCLTATWGDSLICTATYCDSVSVDDDGFINFMDGFTINVIGQDANAVVEQALAAQSRAYPNPVRIGDWLTVEWGMPMLRYELVDALARPVRTVTLQAAAEHIRVSTVELQSGWYVIRGWNGAAWKSVPVLVQ